MKTQRGTPTTIEVAVSGTVRRCRIKGAFEAWNCSELVQQIDPQAGERLIVDLAQVREVDSTGLGELIYLHQKLTRAGGALAIACPSPSVVRLLETTRLCRFFNVLSDEEAVQEFQKAAEL